MYAMVKTIIKATLTLPIKLNIERTAPKPATTDSKKNSAVKGTFGAYTLYAVIEIPFSQQ